MFAPRDVTAALTASLPPPAKVTLEFLALGPLVSALLWRVAPVAHKLDDPLLSAAIVWLAGLIVIVAPARFWEASVDPGVAIGPGFVSDRRIGSPAPASEAQGLSADAWPEAEPG